MNLTISKYKVDGYKNLKSIIGVCGDHLTITNFSFFFKIS